MAKISTLNYPITGKFGNVSIYFRKDCKKPIIRMKTGASKEKIMTDLRMEGTRNQMSRFGGISNAGKSIRLAMSDIKHLGHSMISGELVALCGKIMDLDLSKPESGKQSILFSNGLSMLRGYNLNLSNVFDSVISAPVAFSINRQGQNATIELPELIPGSNFRNPWELPFFRVRMSFGIIRDLYFDGSRYVAYTPVVNEHSLSVDTEWLSTKDLFPAQHFEMQFDDVVFDEHCHFLLAIGIEFGTQLKGGIGAVKDAKCLKILGVE